MLVQPSTVYATENVVESTQEAETDSEAANDEEKDALDEILESDPLSDENVEKGKTIFTSIVEAIIPFIKSFLLALFDFFVAIGRAILDALKNL